MCARSIELIYFGRCPVSNSSLDCLRSVNASELNQMGLTIALDNLFGVFTFVPVVDGDLIVERPTVTLGKNQTNSVSLLPRLLQHDLTPNRI